MASTDIIEMFATNGVFCVMFVLLYFDTRKDSKDREIRYIDTIDKLSDKLGVVEEVQQDVKEIKNKLNI